jgi:hypothetical protein
MRFGQGRLLVQNLVKLAKAGSLLYQFFTLIPNKSRLKLLRAILLIRCAYGFHKSSVKCQASVFLLVFCLGWLRESNISRLYIEIGV